MTDAKNAYDLYSDHCLIPSETSRHGASCASVTVFPATGMPGRAIRLATVGVGPESGLKQAIPFKREVLATDLNARQSRNLQGGL